MQINIPNDHENPRDSQLIISITGSKEAIREKLKKICQEFDSEYGKPCQGTVSMYKCVSTVITPVWNGQEY